MKVESEGKKERVSIVVAKTTVDVVNSDGGVRVGVDSNVDLDMNVGVGVGVGVATCATESNQPEAETITLPIAHVNQLNKIITIE